MKLKSLTLWSAFALLAAAVACSDQKNPTTPSSSSSVTAAVTSTSSGSGTSSTGGTSRTEGVSSTAPAPVSPADGAQIKNVNQPVTLVITNGVATGSGSVTYTFEVATDAGFSNKVQTKDGVSPGANGQTSVTLDKLPAGQTYSWHAHLNTGGSPGPNSKARTFTIGPQVVLATPSPVAPANGSTVSSTPALTTSNAGKQGPAGQLLYTFEVADSSGFAHILFTQTVQEGSGQTSLVVPLSAIPQNGSPTLYWHVKASDPDNSVTTPFSGTFSFTYQAFDPLQATMVDSPYDFMSWAVTSTITSIIFSPDAFQVDFDRRTSPDRYGDVGFGSGSLQYTLGGCFNVNGQHWYCSAVVQFWFGRELTASTPPMYVGRNWFYDSRWGPLQGYQPSDGEVVGLFICPGNCRDVTDGSRSIAHERSNIALVQWTNGGDVTYTYSGGSYISSALRRVFGFKQPTPTRR